MSFERIKNKLNQFDIKRYEPFMHTEKAIEIIESEYGFTLPIDYKQFLLNYGECAFDEDDIYCEALEKNPWAKDKLIIVDYFYGLNDNENSITYNIESYKDDFGDDQIPIASCPGGNEISLKINGESKGKVYFWDHESDKPQDAFYLIAENFTDFIMRFKKQNKNKSSNMSGIVSMEFKDGFFDD